MWNKWICMWMWISFLTSLTSSSLTNLVISALAFDTALSLTPENEDWKKKRDLISWKTHKIYYIYFQDLYRFCNFIETYIHVKHTHTHSLSLALLYSRFKAWISLPFFSALSSFFHLLVCIVSFDTIQHLSFPFILPSIAIL